jgi:integrase
LIGTLRKQEFLKIILHDLRHLHATLLMINGENPKVVAEHLDHSEVGVTLGINSYVMNLREGQQIVQKPVSR